MNIEEQLKQILKIPVIEERYLELIKLLNKDRDRLMKQNKRYKQLIEQFAYCDEDYEGMICLQNKAKKLIEGENRD